MSIAALAGLVLYVIVSRMRFDDPRWQHNGWTYVIAIPLVALILAVGSRFVALRYIHKSVQLGFLFSVFVHLLLLILAVNVVIFRSYFPDALAGVRPERSPVRHTVPEYLFLAPTETSPTPDWSEPVDAETASRVVPDEQRQLPPVEHTAPKLQAPRPRQPQREPLTSTKRLAERPQRSESLPQPSESPGQLARPRLVQPHQELPWETDHPTAPQLARNAEASTSLDGPAPEPPTARRPDSPADVATSLSPPAPSQPANRADPPSQPRSTTAAVPDVAAPTASSRDRPSTIHRPVRPAGTSPAAPTVAVARQAGSPDRSLELLNSADATKRSTSGADLHMGSRTGASIADQAERSISGIGEYGRQRPEDSTAPAVGAGQEQADRPLVRRSSQTPDASPFEVSDPVGLAASESTAQGGGGQVAMQMSDRLGGLNAATRGGQSGRRSAPTSQSISPASSASLDLLLAEGPAGLAAELSHHAGVVPGETIPQVSVIDLTTGERRRRQVGGPVTPFGTEIAAVESFRRRIKRTQGGAAPTPAGAVGPATEEAIERGLQYLAGIQNDDGSWSLQGHGDEVVLRSDTAATGLCLLAFQGAGYTHQQHQFADTIARGLRFLLENQKTNGDLYRSENAVSNDNVALYSHGIASLALCEAFGMTQDPDLKEPAQASLRYISETQHRRRGGWRYTPQVSSDTSVTGWMMMALKSGQLARLDVPERTYEGISRWLGYAQGHGGRLDRYRYNPFAPNTPAQRHGRIPSPTMTAVGMLMRMYLGWHRDNDAMQSAADYLLQSPPQMGTPDAPQRDGYYWYYATMVMFHMGGEHWQQWNRQLKPVLLESQIREGRYAGSWDPNEPVPDRWSPHAGRVYVTTMNLLNLEVYYRHLPIYDDSAN